MDIQDTQDNFFQNQAFCTYEDFIDWHSTTLYDSEIMGLVHTFDRYPKFIRQNYHYKLWKDWYGKAQYEDAATTSGVTNLLHYRDGEEHRKMGFALWQIANHPQPEAFENYMKDKSQETYDPAVRDVNGFIIEYDVPEGDNWQNIFLNETKIYPFYKHLFIYDLAQR